MNLGLFHFCKGISGCNLCFHPLSKNWRNLTRLLFGPVMGGLIWTEDLLENQGLLELGVHLKMTKDVCKRLSEDLVSSMVLIGANKKLLYDFHIYSLIPVMKIKKSNLLLIWGLITENFWSHPLRLQNSKTEREKKRLVIHNKRSYDRGWICLVALYTIPFPSLS